MALYRTYRPASLAEVVGQDHVTGPLRRALENDRVHHAYLFSGPRGCGKTSTARILARSLNCEQGPTPDPCGVCQSCIDLAPNGPGSLDVIELDAASHGGVDDTRELRERAMFAPASSRYKVYIVDEAHMVTTQGFNALLKLVEEPPEHVRFVFATTEADKVLPTIRSRTHNYTFRLVPTKTLQEHLAHVCDEEGVAADPAALALVARAGAGSVRDALSVLGQVISGSGPDGVTYADAVLQLGMTDAALLDDAIEALAAHDGAALFIVVDRVIEAGHDPRRFVTDLLERIRDLIVLKNVPNAAEVGLIEAPDDLLAREVEQSERFGHAELTRAAEVVSVALSELRGATAPRLHLELMAARLLLPAADSDEGAMRARLDQLERRLAAAPVHAAAPAQPGAAPEASTPTPAPAATTAVSASGESADEPPPSRPAAPKRLSDVAPTSGVAKEHSAPPRRPSAGAAPKKAAQPEESTKPVAASGATASLEQFTSMWSAVLDALASRRRMAWAAFSPSKPISLSDGTLAVAVEDSGKLKNIQSSKHEVLLRESIIAVLGVDVDVAPVLDPGRAGAAGTSSPAAGSTDADAQAPPAATPDPDAPSPDDPDVDDTTGVDLVVREFGATQIGEIEH